MPQVFRVAVDGKFSVIESEYVRQSEQLDEAWPSLDLAERETIRDELLNALKSMQDAPHPADGLIASHQRERTAALHCVHREGWPPYTPTSSITEFFDWARQFALASGISYDSWDSEIAPHIRLDSRIVLTHGDLLPRNILVRDGHLAAIVDWELAGWWPEELEAAVTLCKLPPQPMAPAVDPPEVEVCRFVAECINQARGGEEDDVGRSQRRKWADVLLNPQAYLRGEIA